MEAPGRQEQAPEEGSRGYRRHEQKTAETTDANPLGLDDPPIPAPPDLRRWLGLVGFVLLAMAMLATILVTAAAHDKKAALLHAQEQRLRESVSGRVETFETWLDARRAMARRLTESQVFRLFVTDLTLQEPTSPLPRSLQDQRPYFQQLMADFARQNGLLRATVLRDDGTTLLSSRGPVLPIADLLEQIAEAGARPSALLSPIRQVEGPDEVLAVDAVMPMPKAQAESSPALDPSAYLVLTLPIDQILQEVLSRNMARAGQEHVMLAQRRDRTVDRIRMTADGVRLATHSVWDGLRPGEPVAFGRRDEDHPVYGLGEVVTGAPWTLYHAVDARAVLAPLHDFVAVAVGLSALAVLLLTTAFAALWWRQGRNHHRYSVELHRTHARNIDRQRQFLASVTRSIGDWLAVTSPNGDLIYTNPAFDAAVGRSEPFLSGERWDDLVKERPTTGTDESDWTNLIDAGSFRLVDVDGKRHAVSLDVAALKAEDGQVRGAVHIVRDHTELVHERRRRLTAITQTVDAFVHAIELRDPFLLGHTRRLRAHAIAIGQKLDLPIDDLASLALAASLSQIGKIFIPDDVLTKPARHSSKEERIMRGHIRHAVDLLERFDFDLPIVGILAQMHERLDGSGYPHGLAGDQIRPSARILGVADVFCARTAPRSYRERMSVGSTLYHLASNAQRYDLTVIAALAQLVGHGRPVEPPTAIERTFIDASIWRRKTGESQNVAAGYSRDQAPMLSGCPNSSVEDRRP